MAAVTQHLSAVENVPERSEEQIQSGQSSRSQVENATHVAAMAGGKRSDNEPLERTMQDDCRVPQLDDESLHANAAARAPSTKPPGPVIRMPSSGPRLAFGVTGSGPTKPSARPAATRTRPARQLAVMRARVVGWRASAPHQQSTPIVNSEPVIGTQKNQPSLLGRPRLRSVIQPASPMSAAPTADQPKRCRVRSRGGAVVIAPRLLVGAGLTGRASPVATCAKRD